MKNINKELLNEMLKGGFVVESKHPSLDIYLYNYTRKCTYEKKWNEVTLACRGLILDADKNIISLPLEKFFNYEEFGPERIEAELRGKSYRVYDKADGCLDAETIIYTENGPKTIKWICDTKYGGNVISYNTFINAYELKPIIARSVKKNIQNWFRIVLENNIEIIITGNQKVWVADIQAYRRVDELDGTEDITFFEDMDQFPAYHTFMKIKSIEKTKHNSSRYDIEVKDNHNFFANGMLVHNSCGILWEYKGNYGIATRGSFESEQAIFATKLLNEKYLGKVKTLDTDNYTYVWEIIFPENRIVVNYDGLADIIFLARINKNTGTDEFLENDIEKIMSPFRVITRYPEYENMSFEELQSLNLSNKEGFVLHGNGMRIKVKFPDYCRLHSIITNITARDIWKTISQGNDVSEILENVPDEFDAWVRNKVDFFNSQFDKLYAEAYDRHNNVLSELPTTYTKKLFAMKNKSLNKEKFWSGLVFAIETRKNVDGIIWNKLYPGHEKPFANNDDDLE